MRFFVPGLPAPQGSKKGFSRIGTTRVQLVESSTRVAPWREDVRQAAINAAETHDWTAPDAVAIGLTFWMPRPKNHPKTRRTIHSTRPDIDKLTRSTLDALTTAGVIRDDSTVVKVSAVKCYVHPHPLRYDDEPDTTGVHVFIRAAREEAADV